MTKIEAIAHLEDAMKHNPEFRKRWKECIEMAVIDECIELHMRPMVAREAAEKISSRIIRLFDATWWEAQLKK